MVPPYPTLESALVAAHETPSTLQAGDVVTVRREVNAVGTEMELRNAGNDSRVKIVEVPF